MIARRGLRVAAVAAAVALAAGCGRDGTATVRGSVRLAGQPVANGSILFVPVDGMTPTAGAVIRNGEYSTRVPIARMRVEVRASKVVGKQKEFDLPDSPMTDILVETIPAKYNQKSQQVIDVVSGTNEFSLDIPAE
jgi:hypothetical protein